MKETIELLWIHEEISRYFSGIRIGYKKCKGLETYGSFSFSLLSMYKKIYHIKNLKLLNNVK